MLKIRLDEFEEYHNQLLNSKEILLAKNESENPLVCYYNGCDFNDYAEYRKINTCHDGGCYISFKGDYVIAYFGEESEIQYFINNCRNKFVEKLKEKLPNENIEVTENDILINDRKISGASASDYVGFFVSYNPDIELIRQICNKDSGKIPGGLKNYLSEEELEEMIENTVREFEERR